MHYRPLLHCLPCALIAAAVTLSACASPTAPVSTPMFAPTQAVAQATEPPAATTAPSATATSAPALTSTPTAPTPTVTESGPKKPPTPTTHPAYTPLPGMAMYTNRLIFDHVFQVDPNEWILDNYLFGDFHDNFLRHRTLSNCRITLTAGKEAVFENVLHKKLGDYNWEILYYKQGNPYQPAGGGGYPPNAGGEFASVQVTLWGYTTKECQVAADKVLTNLVYDKNAQYNPGYEQYVTPVPRSTQAITGKCRKEYTYLRVGDKVRLVTASVFLRSAPNRDESSKITRLKRDKNPQIELTGGPVCFESLEINDMIFWEVRVSEASQPDQTGWLAEGDSVEPYLGLVE